MESRFINDTKNWNNTISGLKTYSLFFYYPKSVDVDSYADHLRELVYDFKGDRSIQKHQRAAAFFFKPLVKVLNHFFGEDLKDLTLVCIPASTDQAQTVRYKDFSESLCRETGMTNTFDMVSIVKDGTPKHIYGHNAVEPVIEIETGKGFFKGRNVLLFDDIITRGAEMSKYAAFFRDQGANVVGGISLCRTSREWSPFRGNPCDDILKKAG